MQVPGLAGPVYDTLPEDAFGHDAYLAVHRAILAAGGTSSGLSGSAWMSAVTGEVTPPGYGRLVAELAVEPMQSREADDHRYVSSMLTALQGAAGRAAGRGDQVAAAADLAGHRRRRVPRALRRPRRARAVQEGAARPGDRWPVVGLGARLAALLTGREITPEGFTGTLEGEERVLADSRTPARGGRARHRPRALDRRPPRALAPGLEGDLGVRRARGDRGERGRAPRRRRRAPRRRRTAPAPAPGAGQHPRDRAPPRHRRHPLPPAPRPAQRGSVVRPAPHPARASCCTCAPTRGPTRTRSARWRPASGRSCGRARGSA